MENNKDFMDGYDQGWLDCEKYFSENYELIPIDDIMQDFLKSLKNK